MEITEVSKVTRQDFLDLARDNPVLHALFDIWLKTTEMDRIDFEKIQIAGCMILAQENKGLRADLEKYLAETVS